jgi:hypothetical protein
MTALVRVRALERRAVGHRGCCRHDDTILHTLLADWFETPAMVTFFRRRHLSAGRALAAWCPVEIP